MNLHTPERQPTESMAQYRTRQRASKAIGRNLRCVGLGGGQTSREKQRADAKLAGTFKAGTYGLGIVQAQRKRDQQRMAKLHPMRDTHGAYTLTGGHTHFGNREGGRKWLAGISAQRGY